MMLKLGVLHCGGHPLGITVPLPEVLPPFAPVHLGVVLCQWTASTCQANASKSSERSSPSEKTASWCLPWSSSQPR